MNPDIDEATRARLHWPAEWETHAATWLAWPHNSETWPGAGRLEAAEAAFVPIVRALESRERVHILVADDPMEDRSRRCLSEGGAAVGASVEFRHIATDDAWIRDTGPVFVRDAAGASVAVDFRFDAWGGKYPPWDRDAAVAGQIAAHSGARCLAADFVLEGGSVDGNGCGAVLTTEACLLHPNRGAGRSREVLEQHLATWLGATTVLWLGAGITGDDTDGHVDDVARFVDSGTVVAATCGDAADPDFEPLADNLRRLRSMRVQDGKPLSIALLPTPPPMRIDGQRCPASYANFYLANGVALVPTFGVDTDSRALAVLKELLPDRDVVGIPCADLVQGLGAVHCLTQQEPARADR